MSEEEEMDMSSMEEESFEEKKPRNKKVVSKKSKPVDSEVEKPAKKVKVSLHTCSRVHVALSVRACGFLCFSSLFF